MTIDIAPAAPALRVSAGAGFGYLTIDALRRRVYAAHTGAKSLLIADADSGAVIANVPIGDAHSVAFDPLGGHVFVGTSDGSVHEVDPGTRTVLRSADVGGRIDAIAYDGALGRIYADELNGTKLWVIDVRTFKVIATVLLPGHAPAGLAVDPLTHDVYQNMADPAEVAVIDPNALSVRSEIKTPELSSNHVVEFDPAFGQIVTAAANGAMSVFDRAGHKMAQINVPKGIDQCDFDAELHRLACAHDGTLTLIELTKNAAPRIVGEAFVAAGVHTVAVDAKTHDAWVAWKNFEGIGDFVQRFSVKPIP